MFNYFFFYKFFEALYFFRSKADGHVAKLICLINICILSKTTYIKPKNRNDENEWLLDYSYSIKKKLTTDNYFDMNKKFNLNEDSINSLLKFCLTIDILDCQLFKNNITKTSDYNDKDLNKLDCVGFNFNDSYPNWFDELNMKKLGKSHFIDILKDYRSNLSCLYKKNKEGGSMANEINKINSLMDTTINSLWSLIYESPEMTKQDVDQYDYELHVLRGTLNQWENNKQKEKKLLEQEKKLKELEKISYKQQVVNDRRRMNEITDMIVKGGCIVIVIGGIGVACNKKYKFIDKIMVIYEEKFSFNKKMKNITRKQSKL